MKESLRDEIKKLRKDSRNNFEIVPKGHHNCQLSILNCQFKKVRFLCHLPQAHKGKDKNKPQSC